MEKHTLTIKTIERKTNRLGIGLILINNKFLTIDNGEKIGEKKRFFFTNKGKKQICFISDKEVTTL